MYIVFGVEVVTFFYILSVERRNKEENGARFVAKMHSEFDDSRDCRRIRRLSPKTATVAEFGDSATIVACVDRA